jgi:hypothetical protein
LNKVVWGKRGSSVLKRSFIIIIKIVLSILSYPLDFSSVASINSSWMNAHKYFKHENHERIYHLDVVYNQDFRG